MPSIPKAPSPATVRTKAEKEAQRLAKLRFSAVASAGLKAAMGRYVRVPWPLEDVEQIPAVMIAGEPMHRSSLEVFVSVAGAARVPVSPSWKKKPRVGPASGPPTPSPKKSKVQRKGGGGTRMQLHPKLKRSTRCGQCQSCLNPGWKKACLVRRAEQLAGQS